MSSRRAVIDPWGVTEIKNYPVLIEEFGIQPIETVLDRFPKPNRYIRRKIIFGHTDLTPVLDAIERREPYAVMSGLKPTGPFHLGSKMTAEEIIYFQKLSPEGFASYCVADYEAYADNRQSFEESYEVAVDNLADVLALGLDPEKAYVYRQSAEKRVLDIAFMFARDVTYNTLEAIYGDKAFGLYLSALVQAGDILLPQFDDFGGPKPVVVPIGADQAPHIRLTRDLARKHNFILPSATYHRLISSLTGSSKMSKRDPMGILYLGDMPEVAVRKIREAFTGGRATAELQRKLGGEPEKCVVYELYVFHFTEDDDKAMKVYKECRNGARICGDCKKQLSDLMVRWLRRHQEKKEEKRTVAREILEKGS